jgi:phosphatidylglycerol---prolipoprotein diacylglyceryl transferase
MNNLLIYYQHIPLNLNPVALKLGFFSVSWYSLMYIVAFLVVYLLLKYRINRREGEIKIKDQKSKLLNLISDFLIYAFIGLIIGARLGEVLFYNFSYYWQNPLAIASPFDPITHKFIGIYGMSYHGGLIGVLIAVNIFIKKYKVNFWDLADFIIPAVPAGYFFGRIGNFINNELYGRVTTKPWGMYFRDYSFELRYPSQLLEAFTEGVILFAILWFVRNKRLFPGYFLSLYLIGYGLFRFICEFFREPDVQGGLLLKHITLGQWFSIIMIFFGLIIIAMKRKNWYT